MRADPTSSGAIIRNAFHISIYMYVFIEPYRSLSVYVGYTQRECTNGAIWGKMPRQRTGRWYHVALLNENALLTAANIWF